MIKDILGVLSDFIGVLFVCWQQMMSFQYIAAF